MIAFSVNSCDKSFRIVSKAVFSLALLIGFGSNSQLVCGLLNCTCMLVLRSGFLLLRVGFAGQIMWAHRLRIDKYVDTLLANQTARKAQATDHCQKS